MLGDTASSAAHLLQQLLAHGQVHLACRLLLPDLWHDDDQVDVTCQDNMTGKSAFLESPAAMFRHDDGRQALVPARPTCLCLAAAVGAQQICKQSLCIWVVQLQRLCSRCSQDSLELSGLQKAEPHCSMFVSSRKAHCTVVDCLSQRKLAAYMHTVTYLFARDANLHILEVLEPDLDTNKKTATQGQLT